MPIQMNRVEPGIYHAEWLGIVTIEEVVTVMSEITTDLKATPGQHGVIIVDLTKVVRIPFDVSNLTRLAELNAGVVGFVAVRVNMMAQVLLRMLDKLTNRTYDAVDTLEEGIVAARRILEHYNASNNN